ncbi:RIC1 [Novymonas esmeraldas]|uniref:RIC1 n=1 Tax=Novymonas esmeraldas TaxID=1808958 RepID=A0AAW0F1D9_9TRYP
MQLSSGAVSVHCREDVYQDGESVQSMSVNAAGTILAVVTQLRIHFWTAGPNIVYLTGLTVPGTSLEENPALFVLWRQRPANHLAVVTARHVAFFEADINLKPSEFLRSAERKRHAVYLHHVDSAARVCYSGEVPLETGLATSAAAAGPYAFLVTTTAGVVYVLGWHMQQVLHQWTTVGLQGGGHTFRCAGQEDEERGAAAATAVRGRAGGSSPGVAAAAAAGSASLPSTAMRLSMTSAPSLLLVDPLQRRYQRDPFGSLFVPAATTAPASTAAAAVADAASVTAAAAAPPTVSRGHHVDAADGGVAAHAAIRPPGVAVRGPPTPLSSDAAAPTTLPLSRPPDGDGACAAAAAAAAAEAPDQEPKSGAVTTVSAPLPAVERAALEAPLQRVRHPGASLLSLSVVDSTAAAHRSAGAEWLSGTILHASFASRWKVLSFVFSSGSVLLCRPSCGTNFTHQNVHLQGSVSRIVSASMVAMNVRHLLLAVCTQAGAISCRRIDGTSLEVLPTPLWKGLRGVGDASAAYTSTTSAASQSLGLVSAMEWSPSEELLCVAYYKHGVALVHYSGGVVALHLSGAAGATLLRTPRLPTTVAMPPSERESAAAASATASAAGGGGAEAQRRSPSPSRAVPRREAALGCSAVSWKGDGTRLWMAGPGQTCFFSVQLSRVLSVDTIGPTSGNHTPLALLSDSALYLVSVSAASATIGVQEVAAPPEDYLGDQYPLLYGSVSSSGSWVTCAGRRGLVLFNRDRYTWKLASKKEEEESFSCVADPVWLRDVAVAVPALRTSAKTYELIVFSTSSVSPSHASARVALEGRPLQLSCVHQDHRGEGYVVVVDGNQMVRVFRYDVFTDEAAGASPAKPYVALVPVQQLALPTELASPLQVIPVCLRGEDDDREAPQRSHDHVELRLLLHRRSDHRLVWVRGELPATGGRGRASAHDSTHNPEPLNGNLAHVNAVATPVDPARGGCVFRCWVDRTAPLSGAVLLTHEAEQGLVLYELQQPWRHCGATTVPATHRMEVAATRDSELLPLCPSPFDGYMLCIATDTSAPRPSRPRSSDVGGMSWASPRPQLALRPILYAQRILSLLLLAAMPSGGSAPSSASYEPDRYGASVSPGADVAAPQPPPAVSASSLAAEVDTRVAAFVWDRHLFHWLEGMRLNGTFAVALDYFLHTTLNESPPAAVAGLGRRSAVRAAIALLRNYPEFYAIVVGCVRKIDFTRWPLVLDFLGTPTDLFRECVAHGCYVEAVHLVRVVMMGSYRPVVALSVDRVAELGGSGPASRTGAGTDAAPLQQASHCAVELFVLSVENGDYAAAYDILRFMALLEEEIGMPAAGGVELQSGETVGAAAGSAAPNSFLTRWLRQLTFSGAAYAGPDAAVVGPGGAAGAGVRKGGSAAAGSAAAAAATLGSVDGFPTLVFDVARCDATQRGCCAEEAAEEAQRQAAVRLMFRRHLAMPEVVHQEALRLLRTGFVAQLAKLMETFSFSVVGFLLVAGPHLSTTATADAAADGETEWARVPASLQDIFDGLHKELGLPRSSAANVAPMSSTAWSAWLVEQQTAQAAALPGVLSSTNPRVWTVAQSALYASPGLLHTVDSLHRLFASIFVYDLALSVLLMRKSNLISRLLTRGGAPPSHHPQPAVPQESASPSSSSTRGGVSAAVLIDVLGELDALLAVPENAGYRAFLQDVFTSLPPSALQAAEPSVRGAVRGSAAANPETEDTTLEKAD